MPRTGSPGDGSERSDREASQQEEVQAELRKMRFMTKEEKVEYQEKLRWTRAQDVVVERETQRRRMRQAAHELWTLELNQARPAAAARRMRMWLDMSGGAERRAALQHLHEACARFETLREASYSATTHALRGSLGELQDLHVVVLTELVNLYPKEPHYLYALGQLEAKQLCAVMGLVKWPARA